MLFPLTGLDRVSIFGLVLPDVPPLRQGVMHVVKKLSCHRFCALLFALGVNSVTVDQGLSNIQLTRNIEHVEDQCWNSVGDGGPH